MAGSDDLQTLPPSGVVTGLDIPTLPGAPESTVPGSDRSRPGPALGALPSRGDRIAKFVVDRKLGAGAMGVVLLAIDPELDRKVAIKLLSTPDHGDVAQLRLLREAQSAARIQHPNVIAIHEVGTFEGQVYLVMEYVDGGSLREWQSAAHSPEQILETYRQAGAGLAAAHDVGLVHRDFKPDNVLIGRDGRVRVCDFGLVGVSSDPTSEQLDLSGSSLEQSLTQTGAMMGTPAYMSPEQLSAAPLDARSDQFSFCVALYEALYGARPFAGETLPNLVAAVMSDAPTKPPPSEVGRHVETAILRGLARDPADRHVDMHALLTALAPAPRSARPWLPWVGTVALVGTAVTAMAVLDDAPSRDAFTCPPASEVLADAWDDATRAEVADALRRASPARGDAMFSVVQSQLSGYREAWARQWDGACSDRAAADDSDAEYALRRACLERARDDLGALGSWLAHVPSWAVDGLYDLPHTLPDLEACADPVALKARSRDAGEGEPPEPDLSLRTAMWRARTAFDAGGYDRAKAELDDVLPRLRAAGPSAAVASAALLRGHVDVAQSLYASSEAFLHEAIQQAAASHDPLTETIAASLLVEAVAAQPDRVAEARGLVAGVEATARRSGSKIALAYAQLAAATVATSPADALVAVDDAIAQLRELDAPPADLLRSAYARRSLQRLATDGVDAATEDHTRALETVASRMGPEHPALGKTSVVFAEALYAAGELQASYEHAVVGHVALRAALGPHHTLTLGAGASIARALMQIPGRLDDARSTLESTLADFEAAKLDDPRLESAILENLAWLEVATGHEREGIEHYERAAELLPRLGAEAGERAPNIEQAIAWTWWRLENMDQARSHFGKARDHLVGMYGPKHMGVVLQTAAIGDTYKKEGDCTAARDEYRRALRAGADAGMTAGALMARLLVSMGECELADGDLPSARDSLQRAYELRDAEGLGGDWQAPILFAYGKLQAAEGRRRQAIELAELALATYRALPIQYEAEMAEIVQWLRARGVASPDDTPEQHTPAQ